MVGEVWSTPLLPLLPGPLRQRVVIYEALCFDVAQGGRNGAPNETQTHFCRFVNLPC